MKSKLKHIVVALAVICAVPIFTSFKSAKTQWSFIKTLNTPTISQVSMDRYFYLYFSDDRGNLFKYDSLGNELLKYSPQKKADITLLESWRTVNVFLFYRELQEYNLLDRFLTSSNPNFRFNDKIENDQKTIGFARLATLASDNNLWVFDDEDFSLKKYDTRTNQVILNTSLDLILDPQYYDLNFIREYQNLVFINDKNSGVLIFDNLGNYKNKLPYKDLQYFNFLNNSIYFIQNNSLVIYDLYKGEERKFHLPENKIYKYILLANNTAFLIGNNSVDIFKFDFN